MNTTNNIKKDASSDQLSNQTSTQSVARVGIALALSLGLMACSGGEEHEVHAVDKVEEATQLARANAPAAEVVEFEDTQTATTEGEDATTAQEVDEGEALEGEAVEDTATSEEAAAQEATTQESDEEAQPEQTAKATTSAELSASAGKELYESTCHVCHEAGLLGAPKFGDSVAWQPRIAKGIDTLHTHSAEGFKGMPPQATDDVTKEQVYAAVDYMVEHSS